MAFRHVAGKAKSLVLGVCLPSTRTDASKFRIQQLKLDEYFLMYYSEFTEFYAIDHNKICKTGDIVLLQELNQRLSKEINHEVVEVIYPLGNIVDPVTGKTVSNCQFRDDIDKIELAFGKRINNFEYSKAPRRGWQEGKKDLSNREIYYKYHDFEKGDKNEHQPYAKPLVE